MSEGLKGCARCGHEKDGHIDRIDARLGQCDSYVPRTPPAADPQGVSDAPAADDGLIRIAVWNAAKKAGASDGVGYAVVNAVSGELTALHATAAAGVGEEG